MNIRAIAVGIAIVSSAACAEETKGIAEECILINDDTKRLSCYDQKLKRSKSEPIADKNKSNDTVVAPIPTIRFQVLQKGDFDNFAKADTVAKPATFAIQHKEGQDTSLVKLAVIAVGAAFNDAGWQPFGSLAWDRDSTGGLNKRKDLRDVGIGVTGTLFQTEDLEWSLHTTARYRYRKDVYGPLDGNAIGLHANIVKLAWADGKPFIFIPYAGLVLDNRNGGGATNGQWNSAYVGTSIKFPLSNWVRGLSISANYERFHDFSVPNGQTKRTASSTTPEISYEFFDPEDKTVNFRPSIGLSRQIGEDVRSGGKRDNKTLFSLGIKYR